MSVTEHLLAKREESSRRERQPPETLCLRVLTGESTGRPELALRQTEDDYDAHWQSPFNHNNHNHNHECYSALSTSTKTDSVLQCLQLQKQMSLKSFAKSRSRMKVSDVWGNLVPNTWTTD